MEHINQHRLTLIDALADITQQHDRQMLEDSVVKTVNDLFPAEQTQLFRVHKIAEEYKLNLVAISNQNGLMSDSDKQAVNTLSEQLSNSMFAAIESKQLEIVPNDAQSYWTIFYPIINLENDLFAILVRQCNTNVTAEQQLVHGILRVYANFVTLIEKTQRDKLTGLFNRETLDSEIIKVLMKGTTEAASLTTENEKRQPDALTTWLGVIDIDHFKAVNDTYGHLYGDEVLILVARMMTRSCVRIDDLVYRYGGEEFVVMLKAADEQGAMTAFERLRCNVDNHEFPQVGNVAISIGFVEVTNQPSPSDVIGMADEALYYAKENGRNQTVSYQQLVDQGKVSVTKQVDNSDVELFIDEVIF